ncbi:MAG: adenylate/guanylate cyclase domain-containing protein [Hyphomicrobiaceae bacterium]
MQPRHDASARARPPRVAQRVLAGLRAVWAWVIGSAGLRAAREAIQTAGRWIGGLVVWLAELNTHSYPEATRRRLKILNMIAYLIAATTLAYAVQHTLYDYQQHAPLIWVNVALVSLGVIVPLAHRVNDVAGGVVVVASEWIALTLISAMVGANAGVQLQFFIGTAAPFVVFGLERIRLVLATVISGVALNLFCWFQFPPEAAWLDAAPEMVDGIYVQAAITTGALIAASVWYAFKLAESAKAETDRLLRNILPDQVVERLKAAPDEGIADVHHDTAVMFADISGFVALSRRLGPDRVVALLNDIVRSFDVLAERHGVEKIKTIGDAYMAAAGVPESVPDPAARLARFALAIRAQLADIAMRRGIDVRVRIGIASGPLMAGVIGTRKFSYDIWGDTVNLASRLESACEVDRILVCARCAEALAETFVLMQRGEIEIRGVGNQSVWTLEGECRDHPA